VLCVDGDTICRDDALLTGMRLVVKDPSRVVGVTAQIAVASKPEGIGNGHELVDNTVLSNFQHLEYLRTCLSGRLAWSRFGFMFCTSGACMLYRRELLVELGGFSSEFSCEDIEITFRVHEHHLRKRIDYAIVALPEPVVTTEAPERLRSLISQRERWQRVTLEVMWHYRRMFLNPRYRAFGLAGMPYFFLSEIVSPLVELLAVGIFALALLEGAFSWLVYAVFLATMSFATALLSAAAVMLDERSSSSYRLSHVLRLLALSPLELVVYRPVIVWARLLGTWRFLRGHRDWDRFERNVRPQAA
jgi:biofilm PGA synthesis N-glycosyltransferase PgaC